jgi:uncharacterized membrane protein YozB (DUF420 family)
MTQYLPTVNACLNATSAVLLVWAYTLIRRKQVERHRRVMLAAFTTSCLFLVSYLVYHWQIKGSKPFGHEGTGLRTVYLAILLTHTVLAAIVPVLAVVTLRRGLGARYEMHRRIARWTLPIWLYVNVTGVVVYVMLYHL